jgi:hypothetical protein
LFDDIKAMKMTTGQVLRSIAYHGVDIAELYGATGTPSAILVDARGAIGSELAVGQAQILNRTTKVIRNSQ